MHLALALVLVVLCAVHAVPLWVPTLCFGVATFGARSFNVPTMLGLLLGAAVCYPHYPLMTVLCVGLLLRHMACPRL